MNATTPVMAKCLNQTVDEHQDIEILRDKHVEVVLCIVYSIICVFGLAGNLLVIYSVLRHKSNLTEVDVLMFNLAVANNVSCLFIILDAPVDLILDNWPIGLDFGHSWSCIAFAQGLMPTFIHVLLGMDPYSVMKDLVEEQIKMRRLIIHFATVLAASTMFTLPFGFNRHRVERENSQYTGCEVLWPMSNSFHNNRLIALGLMLAFPFLVSAYSFIVLSIKPPPKSILFCHTQIVVAVRISRQLFAMVIVFIICWLPVHFTGMTLNIYTVNVNRHHFKIAFTLFQSMAVSSVCFNPLFYMWINKITIKQFCLVGQCCNDQSLKSKDEDDVETIASTSTVLSYDDRADDVISNLHCNASNLESI